MKDDRIIVLFIIFICFSSVESYAESFVKFTNHGDDTYSLIAKEASLNEIAQKINQELNISFNLFGCGKRKISIDLGTEKIETMLKKVIKENYALLFSDNTLMEVDYICLESDNIVNLKGTVQVDIQRENSTVYQNRILSQEANEKKTELINLLRNKKLSKNEFSKEILKLGN